MNSRYLCVIFTWITVNCAVAQNNIYVINTIEIDSILDNTQYVPYQLNDKEMNPYHSYIVTWNNKLYFNKRKSQWSCIEDCCVNGFFRCIF